MPALLYGWQRKFALVPLTFFMIGWILYAIGFVLKLNSSSSQQNSFSLYIILTGSPVVYVLGMLHAILPGSFSAYVWILLSVASVVCSTSAGWMVYITVPWPNSTCRALNDVTEVREDLTKQADYVYLMFTGTLVGVVSWGVVLLLSVFYQTRRTEGRCNYNEFPIEQRRSCPFTLGRARLLSVPLIILSFLGWCIFLVGFFLTYRTSDSDVLKLDNVYRYLYDLHTCGVSSVVVLFPIVPLLCVASLLHAGYLGATGNMAAVFEAMLGTSFVVFMGFSVVQLGDYLNSNRDVTHAIGDAYFYLMIVGGGVSLLSWAFVVALWPFYGKYRYPIDGRHNINVQHLPMNGERDGRHNINVQHLPMNGERAQPNHYAPPPERAQPNHYAPAPVRQPPVRPPPVRQPPVRPRPAKRRPRLVIAAENEERGGEEQPLVEDN